MFQIVVNTPLWVWPLMLFVLWLGWRGLQPRTLPVGRLAVLPLVGVGTSVAGIAQSMQPGLALLGWLVALLAALGGGGAYVYFFSGLRTSPTQLGLSSSPQPSSSAVSTGLAGNWTVTARWIEF